ncbi:hypothetical protein GGR51DRAFT_524538 [Nemania sp. FL0031]|nr:hypothetical protein GGR51DRAFT_524538 [Nemania sp. FL0031]
MLHSGCKERKQAHFLTENEVPDWGLLQVVNPIFRSAATTCEWTTEKELTTADNSSRDLRPPKDTIKYFRDELKELPISPIDNGLPCDVWDNCIANLSNVLQLLNSLVKDQSQEDGFGTREKTFATPAVDFSEEGRSISRVKKLKRSLLKILPERQRPLVPALPDIPQLSVPEALQDSPDEIARFPELRKLAELQLPDISNLDPEIYLKLNQPHRIYSDGYRTLADFNTCIQEAVKLQGSNLIPRLNLARFYSTNWEDMAPSQISASLHRVLRSKISHCSCDRHEVLLKMNGRKLARMAFDMIIIPCHKQDTLREVEFFPAESIDQTFAQRSVFVHRLCDTIRSLDGSVRESPVVIKFYFEESSKGDQDTKLRFVKSDRLSNSRISIKTALDSLVNDSYLLNSRKGNRFDYGDKAVLELSLAQSLLHLLQTPWMERQWSTPSVRFVQKLDDNELIDIHHPYISCLLLPRTPSEPETSSDGERLVQYQRIIMLFSRVLLEIETGRPVELSESLLTDKKKAIEFLTAEVDRRNHQFELRGNVQSAIRNCLQFQDTLRQRAKLNCHENLDYGISKVIYDEVVRPLETNLSTIENHEELLVYRNLQLRQQPTYTSLPEVPYQDEARTDEESPSHGNMPTRSSAVEDDKRQTEGETVQLISCMFDGEPVVNNGHVNEAKAFWGYHQSFYTTHIKQKGQMASDRIRIAILDTGIDEHDTFVQSVIDKISGERWGKAREEAAENKAPQRPRKSDYKPLKAIKDFVGLDEGIDTCGHGTSVAGLILRVAPEADIYVAKIANSFEFNNIAPIIEAIKWAIGQGVDILSMSFGLRGWNNEIYDALRTIPSEIIVLASASNFGLNRRRAYPAADPRVIGIHAFSGNGDEGRMNPSAEGYHDALGTLGYGIETSWKDNVEIRNGTSYSTPIAAGIVANYLGWVEYVSKDESYNVTAEEKKKWKSDYGIRRVLAELMSEKKANLRFIAPWLLWNPDTNVRDRDIISRLRNHRGF